MANEIFTYDQIGLREDLSDVIYDIAPSDTPLYSLCAKTKAQNTYHEWMTDTLRGSAANAQVEGATFTNEVRAQPTRLGNYSQIFANTVEVTDTDNGMTKAGRKKQMAYEMLKVAKEQKLDIELALFANNARVAGNSTTARELAGLPAWLTTNTQFETGGTTAGADPVTIGSTARTDNVGGQTAFSQDKFDNAMQAAWDAGAKPSVCLLSSFQMNVALGFTGNNNQRSQIAATAGKVSNYMSVYLTPWGEVTFTPSREQRSRDVFIVDPSMLAVAVVRPTKSMELAKVSDSTRRAVVTELTLVVRNEAAHAGIYDNTTA